MRFISTEDFNVQPYNLPAKALSGNNFPDFATRKEEEILRSLLGDLLYEAFVEAWDELPDLWDEDQIYVVDDEVVYGDSTWKSLTAENSGNTPEEGENWTLLDGENKWLKLYAGERYTMSGTRSFNWKGMNTMLVPYIYSQWLNDTANGVNVTNTTAIPKAENAEAVSPITTVCREFNNFSAIAGNSCDMKNTLYGYLYYSGETFLEDVEEEYSTFIAYLRDNFQNPGEMNPLNL